MDVIHAVVYAVDQSQRTAPSDQSQQWKAGFRETDSSKESFRNHLEIR